MNACKLNHGGVDAPRSSRFADADEFSAEDHLTVQRQIERRAYRLSRRQRHPASAFEYLLQAEDEVLHEFIAHRLAVAGRPAATTAPTPVPTMTSTGSPPLFSSPKPRKQNENTPPVEGDPD